MSSDFNHAVILYGVTTILLVFQTPFGIKREKLVFEKFFINIFFNMYLNLNSVYADLLYFLANSSNDERRFLSVWMLMSMNRPMSS